MIKIIDEPSLSRLQMHCESIAAGESVEKAVAEIIDNVRTRGDEALFEYSLRFDRVRPESIEISASEWDAAASSVDKDFLETLLIAHENIRTFHKLQLREGYEISPREGVKLGLRYAPIERVGIYVPGGTAAYPSTVLMNAVPAKLAGVSEIIMVTPPSPDGSVRKELLAAAKIAGVDRVFRVGGAQAVAALAFGTESIPKVDKIVGPGNVYVAAAKRRVFGTVAIDMIAGPSEIAIVSDGKSNPRFIASDMLSQAEHDVLASAVLITDSRELANAVQIEIERQLCSLPREAIARKSIEDNGRIIIVGSIEKSFEIVNEMAPEHLEICTDNPEALLPLVRNAGSVFLGRFAPEALGDYIAGPNHTLPTNGTARFSSPLSVDDFIKKSSYLSYTQEALQKVAGRIEEFARREGLDAHARSAVIRFERD